MDKRIAFFIGQIFGDYQLNVIKGVSEEANRLGYCVEVFSNFGTYGDNYLHAEGEMNIMNLPCLKEYDAIIVAPDTYDISGMYELLSKKILREAECPVVSLRYEDTNFYNVLIEDEKSMEIIVEHMITVHNKKRIAFMTGRMELLDARRRLQGYKNVMEAHNLPITEHMIFEGNYWSTMGEQAVEWFLGDEEMPEAIVCSNDYMAISVCEALRNRGLRIPEDICVTGFDNIDEARLYHPCITSMVVQSEKMGREAVNILCNLFEGREQEQNVYVPVGISYGGTCGCERSDNSTSIREMYAEKEYLKSAIMASAYANVDFERCNDREELIQAAFKYSHNFSYDYMYIFLCERNNIADEELREEEKFTEEVSLIAIMEWGQGCWARDEKFLRKEILPEKYRKENDTIYCYPLHYKNNCIGYLVIQTTKINSLKEFFITWLLSLSNYLDKVRIYVENQNLMQFRQQSMMDELTGLFNRREFERILRTYYASVRIRTKGFFIISCDMDGLKMINDTYGHLEGDKAIITFANILKNAEREGVSSARVGGDEFQICYKTSERAEVESLLEDIRNQIEEYNRVSYKPYLLSASMGYAFCSGNGDLVHYIQEADENMYQEKFKKKNARINQK